jgi:hypothetical protein
VNQVSTVGRVTMSAFLSSLSCRAAVLAALVLAACGGGGAGSGLPPPNITSVTPPAGSPLGGAMVSIAGTDFSTSPAPTVTFGDAIAIPEVSTTNLLIVTAPSHAVGAVDVTVTNGDGQRTTRAAAFTFQNLAPPALTRLSAAVGSTSGGSSVTLTGADFSPPLVVRFGAVEAPVVTQSTTSATVRSPTAPSGPVTVTVTNSDGQVSNGLVFTYQAGPLPPSVDAVSPAVGGTNGGTTVSIAGSNFSATPANPRVKFGDQFAVVLSATATLIVATIPANLPGVVAVTVTNPDAQAGMLPSAFNYVASPVLVSLSPDSGSTGGGEQVELTGMSFDSSTAPEVTFGGMPAIVASFTSTSMTVLAPAHGEGVVDVALTNGDGQASTLANAFTYKSPGPNAPTVESMSNEATGLPSGAVAGGEPVTITGTNFASGATVTFGAAAATNVVFVSTTTLTATTPLAQPAGTVDVTVALPGTGLAGTIARGFTFLSLAPHVVSFDVRGSPPSGGSLLVMKGLNIQANSTVTFDGIPATVVAFTPGVPVGGDELTVVVQPSPLPPGTADGFVNVVLRGPDGQSSAPVPSVSSDGTQWPANFHYGPPPVATGFSPSTGRGLDVTLTGTGFSSDASGARSGLTVLMSGPSFAILPIRKCPNAADPACLAGVVSPAPTSLVATIPAGQLNPGNYAFIVTNFDGQTSMAPGVFVVP